MTESKKVIQIDGYMSSSPPNWNIGDDAWIAYDSMKPSEAKVMTYLGIFGMAMIILSLSLPFIFFGGGCYVMEKFLK